MIKSLNIILTTICVFLSLNTLGTTKHGNYKDSRIGIIDNQNFDQLLFFPEREWLYDFDTTSPLEGITSETDGITTSDEFYMTSPQSLLWNTTVDASITFDANVNLPYEWRVSDILSVGIFQQENPKGTNRRVFKIECLSETNTVLQTRVMYLRKGGWNILSADITNGTQKIGKVRITQTAGLAGDVYIDNLMIFANQRTIMGVTTRGIENEHSAMDNRDDYDTTPLTQAEKDAFLTIAERVIPLPAKVNSHSSNVMNKYRSLHQLYNIEVKGDYANGINPLYYYRGLDKLDGESVATLQYDKNSELNQEIKSLGKAWYETQDSAQKAELGTMLSDIIKLTLTYGGMPNPWYNGRGYAEGVYYAKELLEEEGLLERATDQLIQQYHVDDIMYREHSWDEYLREREDGQSGAFFWQTSCDDLNTTNKSTILTVLVGPDNETKSRNLYRLKSWMEHFALNFSGSTTGSLKPDGSWFHHNGNRFDNYGWVGAWRGATEYVWWMSHTPFDVNSETKERMHYMANIHWKVMNKHAYSGPQDAMQKNTSDGFMNLALAGSADNTKEIDPVMGSYYLAYPNESSYKYNSDIVSKVKNAGVKAASKEDGNLSMNWDISNIHRTGSWQVYTRGIAKKFYHTQYERDGFLFYNIGGISLCNEDKATGMQAQYGTSIMLRHDGDEGNISPGYNFNRALGVTSIQSDYDELRQIYYQKGNSDFVGGLSTDNGKGIFAQEFDATQNNAYADRVAKYLKFKKSYFYFGDHIVALASDIENAGNISTVETGLLQEPTDGGINIFEFPNNLVTSGSSYNKTYQSADVPWFINSTLGTGIFMFPGQELKLFKGYQTFGDRSGGNIISTYLTHNTDRNGYSFILKLNTDKGEMETFNENINSKKPAFKILQQNNNAHVVLSNNDNTTAYAIFDANNWIPPSETILSVNKSCVIMAQELRSEAQMILTVADPDKNIDLTNDNPLGWSLPSSIEIKLNGKFQITPNTVSNVEISFDETLNISTVKVEVKDGLSTEITLQENRKKNSLPWVEDFVMNKETVSDNGLSSWSSESFNPQAVGYAYVENNDFWISGTNCNWQSGIIDISTEDDVTLTANLSCDMPRRLNSNDSLCIFIETNKQSRKLVGKWIDDFDAFTFEYQGIKGDSLQIFIEGRSDKNYAAYIIQDIEVSKSVYAISSLSFSADSLTTTVWETISPQISIEPANASSQTVIWNNLSPDILSNNADNTWQIMKQGIGKISISTTDGSLADTLLINARYEDLPSPWAQISLGHSVLGSAEIANDLVEISGNGATLASRDNMHWIYQKWSGDFEISGQITLNNSGVAGFIVRNDSTSKGQQVSVSLSNEATKLSYRAQDGSNTQTGAGNLQGSNCWLKLAREDGRLKAYESTNGENWELIRSTSSTLNHEVMLGIFVNGAAYPEQLSATVKSLNINDGKSAITKLKTNDFSIYPNPTNDIVTIRNNSSDRIQAIEIIDSNGRTIKRKEIDILSSDQIIFNLEPHIHNSGLHILKITGKQTVQFFEVMIIQ